MPRSKGDGVKASPSIGKHDKYNKTGRSRTEVSKGNEGVLIRLLVAVWLVPRIAERRKFQPFALSLIRSCSHLQKQRISHTHELINARGFFLSHRECQSLPYDSALAYRRQACNGLWEFGFGYNHNDGCDLFVTTQRSCNTVEHRRP